MGQVFVFEVKVTLTDDAPDVVANVVRDGLMVPDHDPCICQFVEMVEVDEGTLMEMEGV